MSSRVAPSASATSKSEAENGRNADALFESRDVREIREVRARTEREAEEKDDELRALVGSSYRDAIASADAIAEMERASAELTTVVAETCETLRSLPEAIAEAESAAAPGPASASADEDAADLDPTYAAGSRVKFLVDTPEKIWGSLEERDRRAPARRFLAARDVLDALMDPTPPDTASASAEKTRDPSDPSSESDRAAPALPRDHRTRQSNPLVRRVGRPSTPCAKRPVGCRSISAVKSTGFLAAVAAAAFPSSCRGPSSTREGQGQGRAEGAVPRVCAPELPCRGREDPSRAAGRGGAVLVRGTSWAAKKRTNTLLRTLADPLRKRSSRTQDRAPDTKVPTVFDLLDESAAGGAREANVKAVPRRRSTRERKTSVGSFVVGSPP